MLIGTLWNPGFLFSSTINYIICFVFVYDIIIIILFYFLQIVVLVDLESILSKFIYF